MEHNSGEFPPHLQPLHREISEELREASEQLQEAQMRYNQAVLARIALSHTLYDYEHPLAS